MLALLLHLCYLFGNATSRNGFTTWGTMLVTVGDNKLRKTVEDEAVAQKQLGVDMAKKLALRVAALKAAGSLADFWPPKTPPERCHELRGADLGKFTVDLKQPYRLIFEPVDEKPPQDRLNEQERWSLITQINLLSIEDTHE
jgi:plasmid maintenance system killer protein